MKEAPKQGAAAGDSLALEGKSFSLKVKSGKTKIFVRKFETDSKIYSVGSMNESDWREKLEFVMAENAQLREQLEFNQTPQVRFLVRANLRMFFEGTHHSY